MKELGVIDLYEGNPQKTEDFLNKVESTLRVQTDYEKVVGDTDWLDIMELTIPYIDNIFRNPNRFIVNEEEIVKIELVKKVTVESIKHLTKNTNLIQEIDKKTGDVRPSKLLNILKEEDYITYENKLIYTLVQNMKFYISKKKKTLEGLESVSEKNDKVFEYKGKSNVLDEEFCVDVSFRSNLNSKDDSTENGAKTIAQRIAGIEQKISDVTQSDVYKIIDKKHIALVRPPVKKTNVVLKNVNFQYAMKLWDFLQGEGDSGENEHVSDHQDYMDNSEIKDMMDETFSLQYLALSTLNKDKMENEEISQKITDLTTDQLIQKIVEMNSELSDEQLKDLIEEKITVIKYRNQANIAEIQKIFKEHFDKYLENLN